MCTRLLFASLFVAAPAWANDGSASYSHLGQAGIDSDGDGIDDDIDIEPCDSAISARMFMPADRTWGMLMYEDNWPAEGDFDFNDAVLAYHHELNYNSSGRLTGMYTRFRVMAVGALNQNGLALRLPGVPTSSVAYIEIKVAGRHHIVEPRPEEPDVVLDLVEDLHTLFGTEVSREFVNTDPALARRPYAEIRVRIQFAPGVPLPASESPFDVFIFDRTRGTEVHLPQYRGTQAMDAGLVGTDADGTSATRAFVNRRGIPFALHLPEVALYPKEYVSIAELYPEIARFGQSAGAEARDFFRHPADPGLSVGIVSPGSFPGEAYVYRGCYTPEPGVCGAAAETGAVATPSAELCAFGTPSGVSTDRNTAFHWWVCQGNYTVPAFCDAPIWSCEPATTEGCTIPNGAGVRTCNGSGTGHGICQPTSCNPGYRSNGTACEPQLCTPATARACAINDGAGLETCNTDGSAFGGCVVERCDTGFVVSGNQCVAAPTEAVVGTNEVIRRGGFGWRCDRWDGRMCVRNFLSIPGSAIVRSPSCGAPETDELRPVWYGDAAVQCQTICWVATGSGSVQASSTSTGERGNYTNWLYHGWSVAPSCDAHGREYNELRSPATGQTEVWSFDRDWLRNGYFSGCDCAGW